MKICTKCKINKLESEFNKDKSKKDNLCCSCKECQKLQHLKNKKRNNLQSLIYLDQNRTKINIKRRNKWKLIKNKVNKNVRKNRKLKPWIYIYYGIKQRCTNPNQSNYKYYGLKGIKCLITIEEIKFLWFRDKAYLMDKPSIDRENNDGHYILSNCRFIEMIKNISKAHKGKIKCV